MFKFSNIQKNTFLSSLLFGFLAYGYMITNKITNNDDIGLLYGIGAVGISNGRWMSGLYDDIFQTINSPWMNGLVFIFFLAVSAVMITDIFCIKNNMAAVSIGAVWMVFPSHIASLFYMFTAVPYAFGIFLAVSAVWIAVKKRGILPSQTAALCIILSLGFYQAYYPVAAGMLLIGLLQYIFQDDVQPEQFLKKAFYDLGILVEGMLGYILVQKVLVYIFHVEVTDYNNLDKMGTFDLAALPGQIRTAYEHSFSFWQSVSDTSFFSAVDKIVCVLSVAVFLYGIFRFLIRKNYFKAFCIFCILLLFPVACSLVYLYGAATVHTIMCLGNICPVFLIIIMADDISLDQMAAMGKGYVAGAVCTLAIVLSLYNCALSSRVYLQQEYIMNASIQYLNTVVTQIKCTENYKSGMPVAFVGTCSDPCIQNIDRMYMHVGLVGENTMQDFIYIAISYDWCKAVLFPKYLGFSADFVEWDRCEQMREDVRIQNMPVYPDAGSVGIIDGTVIVRFS